MLKTLVLPFIAITLSGVAQGQIRTFTDRSDFLKSVVPQAAVTFDSPQYSGPVDQQLASLTFNGMTFTAGRLFVVAPSGDIQRRSLTSNVLNCDVDAYGIELRTDNPIYAIGADFTRLRSKDPNYEPFWTIVSVTLASGQVFESVAPSGATGLPLAFFGLVMDSPIRYVRFLDSTWGIAMDNVVVSYSPPLAVPEPATAFMLILGLSMLGKRWTRR